MQIANWYTYAMCVELDVACLLLIITLIHQEVMKAKYGANCTTAISTSCTVMYRLHL